MDYNKTKCPVCGKLLGERRLTRYPGAIVCGFEGCSKQHRRNQQNKTRNRYRARRYAGDPVFRERTLQAGREQYRLKRLAAGKKVTPRARVATERGGFDAFLSAIRGRAVWALRAVWAAISAIPRNGRAVDAPQPGE